MPHKVTRIKAVIVGNRTVGLKSFLHTLLLGHFPPEYIPGIHDPIATKLIEYETQKYEVSIWFTNGLPDYDQLRPLCYPHTNVFILAFSVVDPDSLDAISAKWDPEIRRFVEPCPPVILLGTKIDLRDDPDALKRLAEKEREHALTQHQGELKATEIHAVAYHEISSLKGVGLQELFTLVCAQYSQHASSQPKGARCGLM